MKKSINIIDIPLTKEKPYIEIGGCRKLIFKTIQIRSGDIKNMDMVIEVSCIGLDSIKKSIEINKCINWVSPLGNGEYSFNDDSCTVFDFTDCKDRIIKVSASFKNNNDMNGFYIQIFAEMYLQPS
jgi:hypothetical protein